MYGDGSYGISSASGVLVNTHMYMNKSDCDAFQNGLLVALLNYGIVSRGLQIGIFNINTVSSVSVGLINYERRSDVQIGVINFVKENTGVQIGAVNIRKGNIPFARILPLMNIRWE